MTEIKIHYIEDHQKDLIAQWDQIVTNKILSPQVFYGWKKIAEDIFGVNVFTLLAKSHDGDRSGLAFLYLSRKDKILYSSRYGFYADDAEIAEALENEIMILAERYGVQKTLLTSGMQEFSLRGNINHKECLYLPLNAKTHDDLWEAIPKKTKNMIRKAEKSDVKVSFDWGNLEKFYDVYADRFLEKSLSIKPLRYFYVLKDQFQDNVVLISALQGGNLVAGMVFMMSDKMACYAYNASVVSAANNGVNNLLMWEAMKYFHGRGIEMIDLSESKPESPVHQFKTRLSRGIIPKTIYYYERAGQKNFSIRLFASQKIAGVLQRLMPLMPPALKRKYLEYLGRGGRVL